MISAEFYSFKFSSWINVRQLLIGLFSLIIGILVYIIDRSPESSYFVNYSYLNISLYQSVPNVFGTIGYSLPSFVHVFSFILLTSAIVGSDKKSHYVICLFWFVVDSLFELGQKYIVSIQFLQGWLEGVPILESTENYFRLGTFDWNDLLATAFGAVLAYIVLQVSGRANDVIHDEHNITMYKKHGGSGS